MTTKTFSHALGEIGDKYVSEAISYTFSKKKNVWMKWGAMAACLCLVVLVGIKMGTRDNFIPLNINTITSASYSAPAITSTIESVQVTEDDVNAWLGFDLHGNLPKEIKDFTMKYYLVRDSEIDETLGVEVWGKVEDAEIPRPQFHITITEGKVLEGLLFDYDVTTDIDGVTVIAGVMPGETTTNRDGEERYWPARYFSLFDVGVYHCTVETQGQVSEDTFSVLNNILVDFLFMKSESNSPTIQYPSVQEYVAGQGNTKSMDYIIEHKDNVTGIVQEVHNDYVIMYSDTAEGYPNGSEWQISLNVENKDSYTDLSVGDEIVVYHDGNVMESDPLKVGTVYAITLKTPADRTENGKD